ncbi:cytochrome c [Flavobacterium sp. LaA7.5]|nr:cytochrome c [Flavobacterium salilacus subsp. altitudinum]
MKIKNIILAVSIVAALCSCESNTYEDLEEDVIVDVEITYDTHIKSIIDNNCISCHGAGGVSSFRPLTNYMEVKDAIENTDLLDRIQRQNGETGLMPQSGRMPMNNIDLIVEWAANGLPEN